MGSALRQSFLVLVFLTVGIPTRARCQVRWDPDLTAILEAELVSVPARTGVFVKHLGKGVEAGVAADAEFDAASVIKLPLLLRAYQLSEAGELDLTDRYEITRADWEPGSGMIQYHDPGSSRTVRDLLVEMIATSDNTATRIIYRMIGDATPINTWIEASGFAGVRAGPIAEGFRPILELVDPTFAELSVEQAHGVLYRTWGEPQASEYDDVLADLGPILERVTPAALDSAIARYDRSPALWYGVMTPRGAARVLEEIARPTIVSKDASTAMLQMMRLQVWGERRIPHFLEAPVAHKTGDGPTVANDVGIVYSQTGEILISFFSAEIREHYGTFEDRIGRLAARIVEYFESRDPSR